MPSEKHETPFKGGQTNSGSNKDSIAQVGSPSGVTKTKMLHIGEIMHVGQVSGYDQHPLPFHAPNPFLRQANPCVTQSNSAQGDSSGNGGFMKIYGTETVTRRHGVQTFMKPEDFLKLSDDGRRALVTAGRADNQNGVHTPPPPPPVLLQIPPPPPPPPTIRFPPPAPAPTIHVAPAPPPTLAHIPPLPPPPTHKVGFVSLEGKHTAAPSQAPTLTPSDSISNRSARTKPATVKATLAKAASAIKHAKGDKRCQLCREPSQAPEIDGVRICSGCVQSHRYLALQSSAKRKSSR